jgi:hypothetical protein
LLPKSDSKTNLSMLGLIVAWAALLIVLVVFAIGRPGAGGALTLAYFLSLSLIHVPGVLPSLGSDPALGDWDETRLGFETTVLGMAAFVAGAVLARWMDLRSSAEKSTPPRRRSQAFERLGRRVFVMGIVSYFVLLPLSGRVPSLTSVVSAMATLLIIGVWLVLYGAAVRADWRRTLETLALLPLLPLATLVTAGFLGYGVCWVLSIIAFLFVISQQRIWFYLAAPVAAVLGLSLFVTYMGERTGIREVVWEEQSSILNRLERVSTIVTQFELLDLASPTHVAALDERLNQNSLVGAVVAYHEDGFAPFAYGATVPLWALIPRALWPDKPDVGGSGDVVTEFTGIRFAEGTSVGVGQVLEFYINFGIPGVLVGFFGLGWLLMWLDGGIMRASAAGDMRGLLLRGMPGLTLLNPGGSLQEMLVACAAAYVAAYAVISLRVLDLLWPARSRRQAA